MTLISTAHKGLSMPSLGITAVVIMTEQSVETVMLRAVNLALDENRGVLVQCSFLGT